MATTLEIRRADELAVKLEKTSYAMSTSLMNRLKRQSAERINQENLQAMFYNDMVNAIGELWKPETAFLSASLASEGERLAVAPLHWPELYVEQKAIALKILKVQSFAPVAELGGVLNNVITRQVDETQDIYAPRKNIRFARHVDANACDWCIDQVSNYETNNIWFRHANCRCFKVKR